jgi:hypothetical protein
MAGFDGEEWLMQDSTRRRGRRRVGPEISGARRNHIQRPSTSLSVLYKYIIKLNKYIREWPMQLSLI